MIGCNHSSYSWNFIKHKKKRKTNSNLSWSKITCKTFNVVAYVEGLPIPSSSILLTWITSEIRKLQKENQTDAKRSFSPYIMGALMHMMWGALMHMVRRTICLSSNQVIANQIAPQILSYIWCSRKEKNWIENISHIFKKNEYLKLSFYLIQLISTI